MSAEGIEGMNSNRTYGLGICPYMVRWWDNQLVQRRRNNRKSGGIGGQAVCNRKSFDEAVFNGGRG